MDVGINGDAQLASEELLARLKGSGNVTALENAADRMGRLQSVREEWETKLNTMTNDSTNARQGE